jgi:hypothetical protein
VSLTIELHNVNPSRRAPNQLECDGAAAVGDLEAITERQRKEMMKKRESKKGEIVILEHQNSFTA